MVRRMMMGGPPPDRVVVVVVVVVITPGGCTRGRKTGGTGIGIDLAGGAGGTGRGTNGSGAAEGVGEGDGANGSEIGKVLSGRRSSEVVEVEQGWVSGWPTQSRWAGCKW